MPPPEKPQSPSYRLIYYRGRGRAEVLRFMLVLSGRAFDDCRISIPQWKTIKQKEGLGEEAKLPVLEINDKELIIGAAEIGRYLATELGFYGRSDGERAAIDDILDEVEKLYPNLTPVVRATLAKNDRQRKFALNTQILSGANVECELPEMDSGIYKTQWEAYKESTLTAALANFSKRLGQNRFFVGSCLTWADLAVAELLTRFEQCYDSTCLREYGTLKEHSERVERLPHIRQWIEDRPRTLF